jgi:hypothetical protein
MVEFVELNFSSTKRQKWFIARTNENGEKKHILVLGYIHVSESQNT